MAVDADNLSSRRSASPTPPGRRLVIRGAYGTLALLLAINLLNYIDRMVLSAVVPQIKRDFGATNAEAGLLNTAFLISYMCAAPIFGRLADRYSRWLLVGIGVLVWSVASGASGLATTIGIMLVTRVFVGIGEAAYGPAAPTIISDLFPVERRGRVLSWFYAAIPVGSALGYLLGGRVLSIGLSWHWAFFIVVPPGILLGVWALFLNDPPRGAAERQAQPQSPPRWSDYLILWKTRSYVFNTAGMTAMAFAVGGIAFWMPDYIVWREIQAGVVDPLNRGAVDEATAAANSIFGPIVVVSGLFATLAGGWVGDLLRKRMPGSYFVVSGVAMLVGFPLVLLLPVTPFPLAWVLIFAAVFCLFFNTGPTNAILANVTKPSIRAAAFALNIFIIHALGDAVSPFLIGQINDWAGGNMDAGFLAVSGAILLSGLLWIAGTRYLESDTARVTDGDTIAQ